MLAMPLCQDGFKSGSTITIFDNYMYIEKCDLQNVSKEFLLPPQECKIWFDHLESVISSPQLRVQHIANEYLNTHSESDKEVFLWTVWEIVHGRNWNL